MSNEALLAVQNLSVHYGVIQALHEISLEIHSGEIVTLIGSNGAGKTTTLGAISGLLNPSGGSVSFAGRDLRGVPPHERVPKGLVLVPE
jgi:branched-chain amino acid transport system ATP-binding protein